jgi:hypothetical protein
VDSKLFGNKNLEKRNARGINFLGFDSYTTPPQQLHNTFSHGGGLHTLSPTPCERVLCSCCGGVVNLLFFKFFYQEIGTKMMWSLFIGDNKNN